MLSLAWSAVLLCALMLTGGSAWLRDGADWLEAQVGAARSPGLIVAL